jgi:hypothetical protein
MSDAKLKHWNQTSQERKPTLRKRAPVLVQGLGYEHVFERVALAGDLQLAVAVGALEIVVQIDIELVEGAGPGTPLSPTARECRRAPGRQRCG